MQFVKNAFWSKLLEISSQLASRVLWALAQISCLFRWWRRHIRVRTSLSSATFSEQPRAPSTGATHAARRQQVITSWLHQSSKTSSSTSAGWFTRWRPLLPSRGRGFRLRQSTVDSAAARSTLGAQADGPAARRHRASLGQRVLRSTHLSILHGAWSSGTKTPGFTGHAWCLSTTLVTLLLTGTIYPLLNFDFSGAFIPPRNSTLAWLAHINPVYGFSKRLFKMDAPQAIPDPYSTQDSFYLR